MGRRTKHNIGDRYGHLEVVEIVKAEQSGKHCKLKCVCYNCKSETMISGSNIHKRNSCGCLQRDSKEWKRIGPKTKPWQLTSGEAARNNIEYQYKRGAKKRNLEYNLTTEEFTNLVKEKCYYCGSEPERVVKGQGKTSGDFICNGIDRLNSDLGYTIDNVVSCCPTCNFTKHTQMHDDFLNHVKKIYENLKLQNIEGK